MSVVGHVAAVWRYPVKSMQGEMVAGAFVDEAGVLGDRAYALRDVDTGYVVSAKHPRRWAAVFACSARYPRPPRPGEPLPSVEITLPDGETLDSADDDIHARLSAALGRSVRLVTVDAGGPRLTRQADRSPLERIGSAAVVRQEPLAAAAAPGRFFDHAPLHLLTTATLDALRAAYPSGGFDARRFRPNVLVASVGSQVGFVENAWLGRGVDVGGATQLSVIDPCPRCVVTTLAQGALPADPGILRTVHRNNAATSVTVAPGVRLAAVAGVYARVAKAGHVWRGDAIALREPADAAT